LHDFSQIQKRGPCLNQLGPLHLHRLKENSRPEITNRSSEEDNSIIQNTVCNDFPYT
jgi:hypothetical protein